MNKIAYLDRVWNSAFTSDVLNLYDDTQVAKRYDHSKIIKKDGILRVESLNFPKHYKVLDIGSGPGTLTLPLAKKVKEVVAIEPSLEMVKLLQKNIKKEKLKNISIINKKFQDENLDFDSEFDAVIASYSLITKNISKTLLKMTKASKKECYIYWFSGQTSWEKEEEKILEIIGKDYKKKLNKCNIIYEILYQLNLFPNVSLLENVKFNRSYNSIEIALDNLKSRYGILDGNFDQALKDYIKRNYSFTETGYEYIDRTKYTQIYWTKEQ